MNRALKILCGSVVFCMISGFQFLNINTVKAAQISVGINYKAEVQNVNWQSPVEMGQEAGSTGLSLEALNINLENKVPGMKLLYQSQVQNIGWQNWVSDGQDTGTIGKSLSIEAVRMRIVGVIGYHISYQVYVDNVWMPVQSDGAIAGTVGLWKKVL